MSNRFASIAFGIIALAALIWQQPDQAMVIALLAVAQAILAVEKKTPPTS